MARAQRSWRWRLWGFRGLWLLVALHVLAFLAAATPGNAVDATARPLLTLTALAVLVIGYWEVRHRVLAEK